MLLGGLWHGASWRFIIWGGLHGAGLAMHKMYTRAKRKFEIIVPASLAPIFNTMLTFHFVCFCWLFFRASSMQTVGEMLNQMIFHFNAQIVLQFIEGYKMIVLLMVVGYILHFLPKRLELSFQETITDMHFVLKAAWMVAIIVLVIQIKSSAIQPFIYFQF